MEPIRLQSRGGFGLTGSAGRYRASTIHSENINSPQLHNRIYAIQESSLISDYRRLTVIITIQTGILLSKTANSITAYFG